jgi:hypothetical protein
MANAYYLVDTNIIISYINNENPVITAFVNKEGNLFFYTETVKKELLLKHPIIPEIFKFVESNIPERRKQFAYNELIHNTHFNLTATQAENFKNDIYIIFEAGFVCYDPEVMPYNIMTEPMLLTNNLKLYNRFIHNQDNQKEFENIINLYGFEHLIRIVRPIDVIL